MTHDERQAKRYGGLLRHTSAKTRQRRRLFAAGFSVILLLIVGCVLSRRRQEYLFRHDFGVAPSRVDSEGQAALLSTLREHSLVGLTTEARRDGHGGERPLSNSRLRGLAPYAPAVSVVGDRWRLRLQSLPYQLEDGRTEPAPGLLRGGGRAAFLRPYRPRLCLLRTDLLRGEGPVSSSNITVVTQVLPGSHPAFSQKLSPRGSLSLFRGPRHPGHTRKAVVLFMSPLFTTDEAVHDTTTTTTPSEPSAALRSRFLHLTLPRLQRSHLQRFPHPVHIFHRGTMPRAVVAHIVRSLPSATTITVEDIGALLEEEYTAASAVMSKRWFARQAADMRDFLSGNKALAANALAEEFPQSPSPAEDAPLAQVAVVVPEHSTLVPNVDLAQQGTPTVAEPTGRGLLRRLWWALILGSGPANDAVGADAAAVRDPSDEALGPLLDDADPYDGFTMTTTSTTTTTTTSTPTTTTTTTTTTTAPPLPSNSEIVAIVEAKVRKAQMEWQVRRFWVGFFPRLPSLSLYERYWRLAANSALTKPLAADIFETARNSSCAVGYRRIEYATHKRVVNFWPTLEAWLGAMAELVTQEVAAADASTAQERRSYGAPAVTPSHLLPHQVLHNATAAAAVRQWLFDSKDIYSGKRYSPDFALDSFAVVRHPLYASFFSYIDNRPPSGILTHEWDRAVVHTVLSELIMEQEGWNACEFTSIAGYRSPHTKA